MDQKADANHTLWLGAVAYDPKVVTIWEGMRQYFRERAGLPVEVVLFLSYEAQVQALLAGRLDIAWNTNLAYIQSLQWSAGACRPLAMRDTDVGWTTVLFSRSQEPLSRLTDIQGRTLALGSKDSGHAAILPVHFLAREGLVEGRDYQTRRFNSDVGKHGDTGTSEQEVLAAVLRGEVDAGAVGSPFWEAAKANRLFPEGALREIWRSPAYNHCMFTARPGLPTEQSEAFVKALQGMSFDNPVDRPILEAEGLRQWLPARVEGYDSLFEAAERQGHLSR
jgi:ABC-type phosphate/phosphonate transport system substrate-binding protein